MIVQSDLPFKRHVQVVSRSSFFQLRHLRNVRHSVDNETAATLIHAFVSSRLDYCNSLLSGAPKVVTDVLQNVQKFKKHHCSSYQKICETSLLLKELPYDWRTANISDIHKNGNKSELCNYRPVSLTCIICKLMEKEVTEIT